MLVANIRPNRHRAAGRKRMADGVARRLALEDAPRRHDAVAPVDLELDIVPVDVVAAKSERNADVGRSRRGASGRDDHGRRRVAGVALEGAAQHRDFRVAQRVVVDREHGDIHRVVLAVVVGAEKQRVSERETPIDGLCRARKNVRSVEIDVVARPVVDRDDHAIPRGRLNGGGRIARPAHPDRARRIPNEALAVVGVGRVGLKEARPGTDRGHLEIEHEGILVDARAAAVRSDVVVHYVVVADAKTDRAVAGRHSARRRRIAHENQRGAECCGRKIGRVVEVPLADQG